MERVPGRQEYAALYMIFLGIGALVPALVILYLALSKKTSAAIKKAAVIALVVIGLTLVTCSILIYFLLGSSEVSESGPVLLPGPELHEPGLDLLSIIIIAIIIISFIIITIFLSRREQKKKRL